MSADHITTTKETYKSELTAYISSHSQLSPSDLKFLNLFKTLIPGQTVLDLGCGHGLHAGWFSQQNLHTTGIDFVTEFGPLFAKNCSNGQFVNIDMRSMEVTPSTYSGIWSNGSLCHITKAEAESVLTKCHMDLTDKGVIYLTLPEGVKEGIVSDPELDDKPVYFAEYSAAEVAMLLNKAGFVAVDITKGITEKGLNTLHVLAIK